MRGRQSPVARREQDGASGPVAAPRVRVGSALVISAFVVAGAGVLAGTALAMPQYRLQAIAQLHYPGPTWSRKTMDCTFCHVNARGGPPWNAFGQELVAKLGSDPKLTFDKALYLVLQEGKDADGDGYPDALEIFAHTLPGDPSSKPTESLAELQARFAAAGGVSQYAPEKADKGR